MGSRAFEAVEVNGDTVRGRVRPAHAAALCAGHFPGDPFLPGAYLAGLMAELASHLARNGCVPRLARVARCTFRARVAPGADIVVVAWRGPRGRVEAEVRASGACAARATLVFGRLA